jgi:SAM-dependent methyltransferase
MKPGSTDIPQLARRAVLRMITYHIGKRAISYNRTWKTFSEKTLAATCSSIDLTRLQKVAETRERSPRILDAACGTGLLLQMLAHLIPQAELYGMDESRDMLAQARLLLGDHPRVHFAQVAMKGGKMADLPYQPASFDLITCTNALHYLDDPVAVLRGLALLLVPQGQMVVEDFARQPFPFPWKGFEWFIKRVDPQHIQAYTLTEAQMLCQAAGLQVMAAKNFPSIYCGRDGLFVQRDDCFRNGTIPCSI